MAAPDPTAAEALHPEGFAALVAAHGDDLLHFAHTLAPGDAEAQDLVQDTFLRAYERAASFRGDASVRTWLHRILHNLAVDRWRGSGRELTTETVAARWADDAYTVDPAVVVERAATVEELRDALVRVPHDQRVAVVLHDVEGWTVPEIADVVGIGLEAGKQRLRRGRMALVTALAQGHERRVALEGVPMRCWEARQHVSDYLDERLPRDIVQAVEAHLERCPTCPPLVSALVGVHERMGALRDPDRVIAPDVAERIASRIRAQARRRP